MMFPYTTFTDGTEITHSHIIERNSVKSVEVNFERAKEGGFDSARCILPAYQWKFRDGFSNDKINCFEDFLRRNNHLLFEHAEQKAIEVLEWDPDFTNVASEETLEIERAEDEIAKGDYVFDSEINWNQSDKSGQ